MAQAADISDPLIERYPDPRSGYVALAADAHFAVGDYAASARFAEQVVSHLSEQDTRNPNIGSVRLTLIAAEAKLGHDERVKRALADLQSSMPKLTTLHAMREWMGGSGNLAGFEPLFTALRLAGIPD